jgi:hypothetical protein
MPERAREAEHHRLTQHRTTVQDIAITVDQDRAERAKASFVA